MTEEEFDALYEKRLREGAYNELIIQDAKFMGVGLIAAQYGLTQDEVRAIIEEAKRAP